MSDYIYYSESIDSATLTLNTLDEATGYPKENMQDRNKNTIWQCDTANVSGYIQIDLGSARACDYIILGNHNYISTSYGIALSYCIDGDGAFTPEGWAIGSAGPSYHVYAAANVTNWIETFSSQTKRYWRLYLQAMGAATNQEIGTIFMGAAWSHHHNPQISLGEKSGYIVRTNEAEGGSRFSTTANTTIRRQWNYDYEYIDETEKALFETWRDNIFMGEPVSRYPFFFTNDSGVTLYYVRTLGLLNFTMQAYQAWQTNIILDEEL